MQMWRRYNIDVAIAVGVDTLLMQMWRRYITDVAIAVGVDTLLMQMWRRYNTDVAIAVGVDTFADADKDVDVMQTYKLNVSSLTHNKRASEPLKGAAKVASDPAWDGLRHRRPSHAETEAT